MTVLSPVGMLLVEELPEGTVWHAVNPMLAANASVTAAIKRCLAVVPVAASLAVPSSDMAAADPMLKAEMLEAGLLEWLGGR